MKMFHSRDREETLDANGEVILNTSSEGVEEGGRESGSDEGGGEAQEPHYKRAPVSQGDAGVVLEGERTFSEAVRSELQEEGREGMEGRGDKVWVGGV